MIDILHNFGLCVSYLERTNSEARAADQLGTDLPDIDIDLFFHFVANNVDHNSGTINDTFNHIGAIACTTNAKMYQLPAIKRTTIKRSEIIKTAKPERKFLDFSYDIKPLKVFKDICCNVTLGKTKVLSNLWQYLWLVSPMKPLWNGFIKAFHESHRPSKTAIHFEPMIDIPSSDFSCIYSTMSFVSDLARKYGHDPVLKSQYTNNKKALSLKWSLCFVHFIHAYIFMVQSALSWLAMILNLYWSLLMLSILPHIFFPVKPLTMQLELI